MPHMSFAEHETREQLHALLAQLEVDRTRITERITAVELLLETYEEAAPGD